MPRIILDQYTSTRIIRDQLTHSCINPNTQTFPLLLDWKSENRTKRSAFLNKGACRGQPEGLRYFGGAFSDGYTCGGQVEGWRYAGRGHPGMCLPLGSAASPKRNGIPMFPRRDLCACVNSKATSRDRSGRGGLCQVWFLSKRGGSLATPLVPPPTPICSRILMRGQQIEKWLRLSLRLSKITIPSPCVASMSTKMAHTWIISYVV